MGDTGAASTDPSRGRIAPIGALSTQLNHVTDDVAFSTSDGDSHATTVRRYGRDYSVTAPEILGGECIATCGADTGRGEGIDAAIDDCADVMRARCGSTTWALGTSDSVLHAWRADCRCVACERYLADLCAAVLVVARWLAAVSPHGARAVGAVGEGEQQGGGEQHDDDVNPSTTTKAGQ